MLLDSDMLQDSDMLSSCVDCELGLLICDWFSYCYVWYYVSRFHEDWMLRLMMKHLLCFSKKFPKVEIEVPILCWLNFCIFRC